MQHGWRDQRAKEHHRHNGRESTAVKQTGFAARGRHDERHLATRHHPAAQLEGFVAGKTAQPGTRGRAENLASDGCQGNRQDQPARIK